MTKKDQDNLAKIYLEAAAFFGGGDVKEDDPLGLGEIRMAKDGEKPDFEAWAKSLSDDYEEDGDDYNEDEVQSYLGELYKRIDTLQKEVNIWQDRLIEIKRKQRLR
jgi:hypothetical protein